MSDVADYGDISLVSSGCPVCSEHGMEYLISGRSNCVVHVNEDHYKVHVPEGETHDIYEFRHQGEYSPKYMSVPGPADVELAFSLEYGGDIMEVHYADVSGKIILSGFSDNADPNGTYVLSYLHPENADFKSGDVLAKFITSETNQIISIRAVKDGNSGYSLLDFGPSKCLLCIPADKS